MGIFKKSNYQKNLDRFIFYVSEIVNKANETSGTPDCMTYLKPYIDKAIGNSRAQIENWNASTDVCILAYKVLYNASFDILSSGQLHIYRGELNPLMPGDKLLYIVRLCLDEYVKRGIASNLERDEQLSMLWDNIKTVG